MYPVRTLPHREKGGGERKTRESQLEVEKWTLAGGNTDTSRLNNPAMTGVRAANHPVLHFGLYIFVQQNIHEDLKFEG